MTNEEIIAAASAQLTAEAEREAVNKARNLLQLMARDQQIIREANARIIGYRDAMKAIMVEPVPA